LAGFDIDALLLALGGLVLPDALDEDASNDKEEHQTREDDECDERS
jgi:hypothetical protein